MVREGKKGKRGGKGGKGSGTGIGETGTVASGVVGRGGGTVWQVGRWEVGWSATVSEGDGVLEKRGEWYGKVKRGSEEGRVGRGVAREWEGRDGRKWSGGKGVRGTIWQVGRWEVGNGMECYC